MTSFFIFEDSGGMVFSEATAFDSAGDAYWMRFHSPADMSKLSPAELPLDGDAIAFLVKEDLPGAVNPTLSHFQGAFGREKLLEMNRLKTFRTKITGSSESFFVDGAPVSPGEDWKNYLNAVYNTASGFLVVGDGEHVNAVVEHAIKLGRFVEFLKYLLLHRQSVGLFLEDHWGTRSLVFIGQPVSSLIDRGAWHASTSRESMLEPVLAHGHRPANQWIIERVLRAAAERQS